MKTLVISDIHENHIRAQSIIDTVEHDRVLLLGDYFDRYGDTAEEAKATAIWLKEYVLYNPKITFLLGNHDLQYIWPWNPFVKCSGYTQEKANAINQVFNDTDKAQFKFHHVEQGFLCSHAGLTNELHRQFKLRYPENHDKTKLEFVNELLTEIVVEVKWELKNGNDHPLVACGWERDGRARYGGIVWCDWNNLSPINGVNQLVGHSVRRVPQILVQKVGGAYTRKALPDYYAIRRDIAKLRAELTADSTPFVEPEPLSTSYNLDTGLSHYTTIDDGEVNIFEYFHKINLKDVHKFAIPDSELNRLN